MHIYSLLANYGYSTAMQKLSNANINRNSDHRFVSN